MKKSTFKANNSKQKSIQALSQQTGSACSDGVSPGALSSVLIDIKYKNDSKPKKK